MTARPPLQVAASGMHQAKIAKTTPCTVDGVSIINGLTASVIADFSKPFPGGMDSNAELVPFALPATAHSI